MLPWREQIIELPGGRMNAVSFGKGPRPMLLISGLNLRDVRGPDAAFVLWALYRGFGRDHTVWCFDRREDLPEHYSLSQIAEDTAAGMEALGLRDADVLGVSQGGMIAQYLAIEHGSLVRRLVLGVTLSRPNSTLTARISDWCASARRGELAKIAEDAGLESNVEGNKITITGISKEKVGKYAANIRMKRPPFAGPGHEDHVSGAFPHARGVLPDLRHIRPARRDPMSCAGTGRRAGPDRHRGRLPRDRRAAGLRDPHL